jgi:DNA segregation ATPase FtsK/SpoIIIE-like protein
MSWKTKTYLAITFIATIALVTLLILLPPGALYVIAGAIGFSFVFGLVGAGLYLGLIAYENWAERHAQRLEAELKASIHSTPHADYTIRSPNRHLVRLTDSPYLEWNGQERPTTNEERWAFYTKNAKGHTESLESSSPVALLPAAIFPDIVYLKSLVQRGDLQRLVIGVDISGQPVTISIHDLFHTIAAGSSGWGKSMFICAILDQMATAPSPVEMVLIDQQDHGLAPFRNCPKLRYPLLRQPGEILSALREVYQEAVGLRSELFKAVDADNLADYNALAVEPLPPIIVAVDEASALLSSDKAINDELKRQAWELRKFGVYQFLMLTSAKGTTLDTDHRQQFASKIQLHAADGYQARLLMNAKEATDFPKGRAMVDLPGMPMTIVQTPLIDRREIRSRWPIVARQPIVIEEDKDSKFKRLVTEGLSRNQACLDAYGQRYAGSLIERGKRALGET